MAGVVVAPQEERRPGLLGSLMQMAAPFVAGPVGIGLGIGGSLLNGQTPNTAPIATQAKAPVQASPGQGTTGFTPKQSSGSSFRDAYLYNNRFLR